MLLEGPTNSLRQTRSVSPSPPATLPDRESLYTPTAFLALTNNTFRRSSKSRTRPLAARNLVPKAMRCDVDDASLRENTSTLPSLHPAATNLRLASWGVQRCETSHAMREAHKHELLERTSNTASGCKQTKKYSTHAPLLCTRSAYGELPPVHLIAGSRRQRSVAPAPFSHKLKPTTATTHVRFASAAAAGNQRHGTNRIVTGSEGSPGTGGDTCDTVCMAIQHSPDTLGTPPPCLESAPIPENQHVMGRTDVVRMDCKAVAPFCGVRTRKRRSCCWFLPATSWPSLRRLLARTLPTPPHLEQPDATPYCTACTQHPTRRCWKQDPQQILVLVATDRTQS